MKSISSEKLRKVLTRLEAERHGRSLGVNGKDAAVVGEWLAWITPEIREAATRAGKASQRANEDVPKAVDSVSTEQPPTAAPITGYDAGQRGR